MTLPLKSGLLCVFTFTLPLFSPLPRPPLLRPLPLSGDGDEEHALLSHGVCQEWGDLRWVIFSSTRSIWPQYLKNIVPHSPFMSSPYQLYKNICTVASVMFLTNKEVSKSCWVCVALTLIPASISKVTWLMEIWEQCPDVALVMCT